MDTDKVQAVIDDLVAGMLAKGFQQPYARVSFKSHEEASVSLNWYDEDNQFGGYQFFYEGSIDERLVDARVWIGEQASRDERLRLEFTRKLASLIEFGRASGIPDGWVSPLETSMKKLSKNVLTHEGVR